MARRRSGRKVARKVGDRGFTRRGAYFDPPPVNARPWNRAVLTVRGVTATPGAYQLFTLTQLATALRGQLGVEPITKGVFIFRLMWAQVWLYPSSTVTAATSGNLGVIFYSLVPSQGPNAAIHSAEDVATPVRPASVRYSWSRPNREVILSGDQAFHFLAVDATKEGLSLIYQISLLWQSTGGDIVPSFSWQVPEISPPATVC